MAIFCDDGGDNSDGTTWAKAYTTIATAITNVGADNIIYVGHDHNENFAGIGSIAGNATNPPVMLISCDRTAGGSTANYLKATSPQFETGDAFNRNLDLDASISMSGIYLRAGDSIVVDQNSDEIAVFEDCTFEYSTGEATGNFRAAQLGSRISRFINCEMINFNTAGTNGEIIQVSDGTAFFEYCTFRGNTSTEDGRVNGPIFECVNHGRIIATGCDFSNYTSADEVIEQTAANYLLLGDTFDACQLPSGVTFHNAGVSTGIVEQSRSDAATYSFEYYLENIFKAESSTANIRGGGASDGSEYSMLVTSGTDIDIGYPGYTPWVTAWVDAGTHTFTMYLNSDDSGHTDTDIWMETEYLAASNVATLATTRNSDIVASGTALTADTDSEWTTNNNRYKIASDALTVGTSGLVRCRIVVAVDITDNLYIDPAIEVS